MTQRSTLSGLDACQLGRLAELLLEETPCGRHGQSVRAALEIIAGELRAKEYGPEHAATRGLLGGLGIVHQRGLDRPTVICDWCGQPITDARDGNYQWRMLVGDDIPSCPERMYFTHKHCCRAFEAANDRGDVLWGAMELEVLPVFLARNLGLRWGERKAAVHAAWMMGVSA